MRHQRRTLIRRTLIRAAALAVSAASIASAYACGCTDAGCVSTLILHVSAPDGTLPTEFSGTIVVDGKSAPFVCPDMDPGRRCTPGRVTVWLPVGEPDSDTLTIEIDAGPTGTFTGQLEPDYQDFGPDNGPFCGPTCSSTEIAVTLSR